MHSRRPAIAVVLEQPAEALIADDLVFWAAGERVCCWRRAACGAFMTPEAALEKQLDRFRQMTGEERLKIAPWISTRSRARWPEREFASSIQRPMNKRSIVDCDSDWKLPTNENQENCS